MHTLPHLISGLQGTVRKLGCWSGLYEEVPEVFEPKNEEQLRSLFEYAVEHGCKITFRSGEHSFDSQSLNDDMVAASLITSAPVERIAWTRAVRSMGTP